MFELKCGILVSFHGDPEVRSFYLLIASYSSRLRICVPFQVLSFLKLQSSSFSELYSS